MIYIIICYTLLFIASSLHLNILQSHFTCDETLQLFFYCNLKNRSWLFFFFVNNENTIPNFKSLSLYINSTNIALYTTIYYITHSLII